MFNKSLARQVSWCHDAKLLAQPFSSKSPNSQVAVNSKSWRTSLASWQVVGSVTSKETNWVRKAAPQVALPQWSEPACFRLEEVTSCLWDSRLAVMSQSSMCWDHAHAQPSCSSLTCTVWLGTGILAAEERECLSLTERWPSSHLLCASTVSTIAQSGTTKPWQLSLSL